MTSINYSIATTKLANQRTYLAYVRTGFVIAGVSGVFKKYWIAIFGLIMIIGSTVQYYLINEDLDGKKDITNDLFDNMPIIYVLLSVGVLYLQMKNLQRPEEIASSSTLTAGKTSAITAHSENPSSAATALAVSSPSPVSIHTDMPIAFKATSASFAPGLGRSRRPIMARSLPSTATSTTLWPPLALWVSLTCDRICFSSKPADAMVQALASSQDHVPTTIAFPCTTPFTPRPVSDT